MPSLHKKMIDKKLYDKQIYLDCDVTPDQCGSDDEEFSDGTRHVCEDCLTDAEAAKYYEV